MNWLKLLGIVTVAWMLAVRAQAEIIELPQDELAKESVLPVFDRPVSVKNRNVVTDGKIDVNLSYGLALSEPIYNTNRIGLGAYYNTSENNAFGLIFEKMSSGLSSYANQLNTQFALDFKRAPSPDSSLLFDWDWKMFYGKMSVTKDGVFNTSLYTTLAGGFVKYTHKTYAAIAPGLGTKFYFGSNFSLRFDLRLYVHQAPIPFLAKDSTNNGAGIKETDAVPTADQFTERLTYTSMLNAGISWLF